MDNKSYMKSKIIRGGDPKVNDKSSRTISSVAVAGIFMLGLAFTLASCGKTTSHDATVKKASITLKAIGPEGDEVTSGSGKNIKVRSNGADSIEFIATVYGLSSAVGFFVPPNYGIFSGNSTPATDGFTYFTARQERKSARLNDN